MLHIVAAFPHRDHNVLQATTLLQHRQYMHHHYMVATTLPLHRHHNFVKWLLPVTQNLSGMGLQSLFAGCVQNTPMQVFVFLMNQES